MKYIIYICFLLSILFSQERIHRCGLDLSDNNRENPPICDNYFDSENGYFRIHYGDCQSTVETSFFSAPVNATTTYLNAVAEAAEYSRNLLLNMGFNQAVHDAEGIYHIYLSNRSENAYGVNFFSSEGGSFINIDNDYSGFTCGPCHIEASSLELMKITVAHEYFHAVQRAYSPGGSDLFFWEMSSTWFEDVAYPDINDYLNWAWYTYLEDPENNFSSYIPAEGYSLALFGHYLTQTYDQVDNQNSDIIRLIWESFDGMGNNEALQSIHDVLNTYYNSSFSEAWTDFNVRNNFNSEFQDMDNTIYYYEDQKYIPSLTGLSSFSYLPTSNSVNNIVTAMGDLEIRPYQLTSPTPGFMTLDLSNSEDCGTSLGGIDDFSGFLGVKSNDNNLWHRIYDLSDLYVSNQSISINPGDVFYFVLASKNAVNSWNYCLDIPISFSENDTFPNGDLNLNNEVNIIDLVLLISVILEEVSISQYQYESVDFNNDSYLNIIDAVTLINIILNS